MHKALKTKKIFILSSVALFVILLFGGVFSELGLVSNPPDWASNLFMIYECILIIIFSKIKNNKIPKILYGGSVNKEIAKKFTEIDSLDGFLIGGASKSSKKFIDIIKNFYK